MYCKHSIEELENKERNQRKLPIETIGTMDLVIWPKLLGLYLISGY
jgi:hypothetical protein